MNVMMKEDTNFEKTLRTKSVKALRNDYQELDVSVEILQAD